MTLSSQKIGASIEIVCTVLSVKIKQGVPVRDASQEI